MFLPAPLPPVLLLKSFRALRIHQDATLPEKPSHPPVLPKSLILPLGENLPSPCLVLLFIGEKLSSPLDARFLEGKARVLPTSDPYNAGLGALLMDGPRWLHLI